MKRKLCSSKILLEKNRSSQRMATEVCFKVNEQNKGLQLGGHHLFSAAEVPHGKHKAENQKEKKKKNPTLGSPSHLAGAEVAVPRAPWGLSVLGDDEVPQHVEGVAIRVHRLHALALLVHLQVSKVIDADDPGHGAVLAVQLHLLPTGMERILSAPGH